MLGKEERVVVGVVSGGRVFLCNLYDQRLVLVSGCGFFFGFEVVGLLFWKDWRVRVFREDCYVVK